jgi:hypothetical protein
MRERSRIVNKKANLFFVAVFRRRPAIGSKVKTTKSGFGGLAVFCGAGCELQKLICLPRQTVSVSVAEIGDPKQ